MFLLSFDQYLSYNLSVKYFPKLPSPIAGWSKALPLTASLLLQVPHLKRAAFEYPQHCISGGICGHELALTIMLLLANLAITK